MSDRSNNKRIARNSILLYLRMIIVMAVNLYTVRVVLNALGAEDYGIFNVIAGIITMLSCVTHVLSTATQRFYSYSMGENANDKLRTIFTASFNIYIIFSVIVIILGETVGLWFVNSQLSIPLDRMVAANWIYQFSIFSFVFSMLQCPYSASVIAHEDMGIFAAINLSECFLKLVAAVTISFISFDKLIYFGSAQMVVPFISLLFYVIIGRKKYPECYYERIKNRRFYKDLISFSGWNLFASLAGVGMNQVINILINIFFGPVANAARAIAMQINGAMNSFSSCFIMALRPPMIKSYAEGNYGYLNKLFSASNKLIYYSMLIVVVPIYNEMDYIIKLWLKSEDVMTISFSQLILIYIMIMVMNNPISIVMQAAGKVKEYFVPVESMTILCPFICWWLFLMGLPAEYAFYSMIAAAIISHIIRLVCLNKYYIKSNIKQYIIEFVLPAIFITLIDYLALSYLREVFNASFTRVIIELVISCTTTFFAVYLIGISSDERDMVRNYVVSKIKNK